MCNLAVEIAKEVQKELKAKKFIAQPSTYVRFPCPGKELPQSMELQDILKKNTAPCKVCALGAMFTAQVAKYDDYAIDRDKINFGEINLNKKDIFTKLEEAFTSEEMVYIEAAFERDIITSSEQDNIGFDEDLAKRAKRMFMIVSDYDDGEPEDMEESLNPEERLMAICQNIIDNKGNFVVS